jgi:hypothetical protein
MERIARRRLMFPAGIVFLYLTGVAGPPAGARLDAQSRNTSAAQPAKPNPCASPANTIIAENCKPGNPPEEWDINSWGDPSIQGFATDISVNHGETVAFKVKTDATAYRIDVYRMGYYGGKGARLITTMTPSASLPQAQPDCLSEAATRLIDCGNWKVSASWRVPADAASGVYVARLVRTDPEEDPHWRPDAGPFPPRERPAALPHAYGALGTGKLANALKEPRASHIIFIVRDDEGKSDLLVQTSDPTWTAYNRYGGSSTYGSFIQGMPIGQFYRAYKVSYNRPIVNREWRVDHFFHAEYPMVRWIERNGYNVSYFAGLDSDRRGEKIKEHRILLSVGHDEYWSGNQRKNVEAARDAGVNLAFLSGNEVFWKIRYEPSMDKSKTSYRTLVTYKETHSRIGSNGELVPGRKLDPLSNVWTGTWRDASTFNPEGPQPENALMGVIFTVNAWRYDPIKVPADYARMRLWRNTSIANLKPGEVAILDGATLGHEWDEDLDNGFRPAGLIHMSETKVDNVQYIQDWGSVYDAGTATHHLTLYRAKSGALVFGAGTVQWSWGLDGHHDTERGLPVERTNRFDIRVGEDPRGEDARVQQATVNLFADMGVQPGSLQPNLTPATPSQDKTSPVSRIVSPLDGSAVAGPVVKISGTAADRGGGVVGGVEVSVDGGATWHPAIGRETWTYEWNPPTGLDRAVVMSRATDDNANQEMPIRGVTVTSGRTLTSR